MRTFTFMRNQNDLVKPIGEDCEIVTIPFRSNLGPEIITKVMNSGEFEIATAAAGPEGRSATVCFVCVSVYPPL